MLKLLLFFSGICKDCDEQHRDVIERKSLQVYAYGNI